MKITFSDNTTLSVNKDGNGKTIVFVHGFSLDQSMWNKQVEHFKKHYQVLTYDLRGFGESSGVHGQYSHSDDLLKILKKFGLKDIHLVGLSLGGEVAIDFTIEHPEYVSTLVLADSSLGGYKSTVNWDVHAVEQGLQQAKKNWLNHEVFAYSKSKPLTADYLKQAIKQYSGWHWLNKDQRKKLSPTALERLSEITIPTLILVGEYDLQYYHDIASILKKEIRNSQQAVIPKAGHLINIDNPEFFNKEISAFFNG